MNKRTEVRIGYIVMFSIIAFILVAGIVAYNHYQNELAKAREPRAQISTIWGCMDSKLSISEVHAQNKMLYDLGQPTIVYCNA